MDMPSSAIAINYRGLQESRISHRPGADWQNIYRIPINTQTREDLRYSRVVVVGSRSEAGNGPHVSSSGGTNQSAVSQLVYRVVATRREKQLDVLEYVFLIYFLLNTVGYLSEGFMYANRTIYPDWGLGLHRYISVCTTGVVQSNASEYAVLVRRGGLDSVELA